MLSYHVPYFVFVHTNPVKVIVKTNWSGLDQDLVLKRRSRVYCQAMKVNSAICVSSVALHEYSNMIYTSLSLCCLECTTEGTEKRRSLPEDGKEVAIYIYIYTWHVYYLNFFRAHDP